MVDALEALEDPAIEVTQVPASLLDQRLARDGFFENASDRNVEIHARSLFLQGVAMLSADRLPPHLAPCRPIVEVIQTYAEQVGEKVTDVWFDYARSLPVIRLVIGTESLRQLNGNAERLRRPLLESVGVFQILFRCSLTRSLILPSGRIGSNPVNQAL